MTLMTGHDEDIVNHRSLDTSRSQFGLISDLGLVFIKVLRQFYLRLFDEFQVARATDGDAQCDRIICLRLCLIERGRDRKMSHTTREASRTLRQGIHLDFNARSYDFLLYLDITATSIEESLKGIDIAILLHNDTLKGNARNLELSRHLREHHILTPRRRLIRTTVKGLNRETLLRRQTDLLSIKTLQVWHVPTQTGQSYKSINLIGQQDWLLFVDTLLIGTDLDKEV